MCSMPVKWRYATGGGLFGTYCSKQCHNADNSFCIEKRTETIKNRYGVTHQMLLPSIRKKQTTSMVERHGVEYSGQSPALMAKKQQTSLERHGDSQYTNREQAKCTMVDRHGVEYSGQSTTLTNKRYNTNISRHGVKHPSQLDAIKKKVQATCEERYGKKNYTLTDQFKQASLQTHLGKFNVANVAQRHMVDVLPLIESYDWLYEQYINLDKTAYQIASELNVSNTVIGTYLRFHEIAIKNTVRYSYACIKWLESIINQENIYIQHAGNVGEYNIPGTRYKADGYCQDTNTIYEFYGDYWHGNPQVFPSTVFNEIIGITMGELYQKTIVREQHIRQLGYNLITVWENHHNILTKKDTT